MLEYISGKEERIFLELFAQQKKRAIMRHGKTRAMLRGDAAAGTSGITSSTVPGMSPRTVSCGSERVNRQSRHSAAVWSVSRHPNWILKERWKLERDMQMLRWGKSQKLASWASMSKHLTV